MSSNSRVRDKVVGFFGKIYVYIFGVDTELCQNFARRSSLDNVTALKYVLTKTALLAEVYKANKNRRLEISQLFFGATAGVEWAKKYNDEGFDSDKHFKQKKIFHWLSDLLDSANLSVHEIGTSSGRQSAFFAKKYKKSVFVASDVFPEVVAYCESHHKYDNLGFITIDAGITNDIKKIKEDLLLVAGSAAYLNQEELNNLYGTIDCRHILIGEPTAAKALPATSIPRGGFQWFHNHKYYLEKNGWTVKKYQITECDGGRWENIYAER